MEVAKLSAVVTWLALVVAQTMRAKRRMAKRMADFAALRSFVIQLDFSNRRNCFGKAELRASVVLREVAGSALFMIVQHHSTSILPPPPWPLIRQRVSACPLRGKLGSQLPIILGY